MKLYIRPMYICKCMVNKNLSKFKRKFAKASKRTWPIGISNIGCRSVEVCRQLNLLQSKLGFTSKLFHYISWVQSCIDETVSAFFATHLSWSLHYRLNAPFCTLSLAGKSWIIYFVCHSTLHNGNYLTVWHVRHNWGVNINQLTASQRVPCNPPPRSLVLGPEIV